MLRLTQDRKNRRLATGVKVEKKYWDTREKVVKTSCPLSSHYNKINRAIIKKAALTYANLLESIEVLKLDDLVQ